MVADKIKAAVATMQNQGLDVILLALLKMDEITDRWTVILSAPFTNESHRAKTARELITKLDKNLTPEEKDTIARFGVFPPSVHLVEELLKYKPGTYTDIKANGNTLHEAVILLAKNNLDDGLQTSLLQEL